METNTTNELLELIESETGKAVTPETRIDELGIDSLEFVCLMQSIEEKFKAIPEVEWSKLDTVGDILKALG
jgi:acyl carrier protein